MRIEGIEWRIFDEQIPYPEALALMEARAEAINAGAAPETIWLMEHPALLTLPQSFAKDLPAALDCLPVLRQKRGGGPILYGPGLRMAYPLLRVADHAPDISCFVRGLEKWAIAAFAEFNLPTVLRPGHLGAWLGRGELGSDQPRQLCSLSVRVRRGISLQGLALHLEPDLAPLNALRTPDQGEATSLVALGYPVTQRDLDVALMRSFKSAMKSVGGSCTTF